MLELTSLAYILYFCFPPLLLFFWGGGQKHVSPPPHFLDWGGGAAAAPAPPPPTSGAYVLYPCHTYRRSAVDRCALSDFDHFHQSAVKTPKNVAHIALWFALTATICVPGVILVRSQRKYATCLIYALTAPKSPSLHFRYVYMGYSATSSVYF